MFMVGDVKQSIYRFRLARPELFMEKYETYAKEDSPYQKIELHKNVEKIYRKLPEVLNEREKKIIILRYGLYNKKVQTQREIANRIGISRSYVSRIEKHALEKLKKSLNEE